MRKMLIPLYSWYECIRKVKIRKVKILMVEILNSTRHAIGATKRPKENQTYKRSAGQNNHTGGPLGNLLTINYFVYYWKFAVTCTH